MRKPWVFLHIREGKAYYTPDVDACYMLTSVGIYAGGDRYRQALLNAWLYIDFWRYDHGKYPTFLAIARRMASELSDAPQEDMKGNLQALESFFAENADALSVGETQISCKPSRSWLRRLAEKLGFGSGGASR